MKTEKVLSQKQGTTVYFLLTLSGLLMLILAQDFGWAGISLALALIFNPYPEQKFTHFNVAQKVHILGQMVLAMLFIGFHLFQTVLN